MTNWFKYIFSSLWFILIVGCSNSDSESKHQEPAKHDAKYESALATIANIDSINFELNWQEIKPGLWQSEKGDLGIKESRMIYLDSMLFVTDFITKVDSVPMNNFINLPTFVRLSSNFYKDAYWVYHYYPMAYGGFFSVLDSADNNSFEIIGDCYARDINYIYSEKGDILENIDPLTFFSTKGAGCFAMDKNGFYFWGEPINEKDLAIEEIQYIELLKKKFNDPDTLFSESPGYQVSPSLGKTKIKFSNFSLTINSLFENHNLHKDTVLIFEEVGEYLVGRELTINSKDPNDTFKLYIQSVDYVHELIKSDSTGYVGD